MEYATAEEAQKAQDTALHRIRFWGITRFSLISLELLVLGVVLIALFGIEVDRRFSRDIELNASTCQNAYERVVARHKQKIEKAASVITTLQPRLDPRIALLIADSMIRESKRYKVNLSLLIGVCYIESKFNPLAVSSANASGLMQVRYSVWREESELKDNGVKKEFHLFWIDANIKGGAAILKKFLNQEKGDLQAALFRYNTGSDIKNVKKYEGTYTNDVIRTAYQAAILLGAD